MKATQWTLEVRHVLQQWWQGVNACEMTGAHRVCRLPLGAWVAISLHHSDWPDSAWH